MAVFGNFKGTTQPSYKVGKAGSTYHGASNLPASATAGDIWTDTSNTTLKIYDGNDWINGTFTGHLDGYMEFQAQAGENLAKGDVVYVSGNAGNVPVVSKARANSTATMPGFGVATQTINSGNQGFICTQGLITGIDTSSFTAGDTLYVSSDTSGGLANTAPTGESNRIQNIGRVVRSSSGGSVLVGGAGRFNATNALDSGNIFIGNSSNAAVTANLEVSISSLGFLQNVIVSTSNTAPGPGNVDGTLWYDSNVGTLRVYYDDGASSQWVEAVSSVGGGGITTDLDSGNIFLGDSSNTATSANLEVSVSNLGFLQNVIVSTSNTSPTGNVDGTLWWDSDDGTLRVYYDDGNSSQWVEAVSNGGLSGTVVDTSPVAPLTPQDGQLWWDSDTGDLKVYYADNDSSQWVGATSTTVGFTGSQGVGFTGSSGASATLQQVTDNGATTTNAIEINGTPSGNSTLSGEFLTVNPSLRVWNSTGGSGIYLEDASLQTTQLFQVNSDDAFAIYRNGSERLRILNDGTIGIGTTTPDSNVSIEGNVESNFRVRIKNNHPSNTSTVRATLSCRTTENFGGISWRNDGYMEILNNTGADVWIDPNGNVGMGTATVSYRLVVDDPNTADTEVGIFNDSLDSSAALWLGHGTTRKAGIKALKQSTSNNHDLLFYTNPGASDAVERMRIDENGNVGIGTSFPVEQLSFTSGTTAGLHLASGTSQGILKYNNYFNGSSTTVSDTSKGSASVFVGTGSKGDITLSTAAAGTGGPTARMTVSESGSVGINQPSPERLLHVTATPQIAGLIETTNSRSYLGFRTPGSTATYGPLIGGESDDLVLATGASNSERMRIDSDGNVGIGEAPPSDARLQVRTAGVDSRLRVRASGGADHDAVLELLPTSSNGAQGYSAIKGIGTGGANGQMSFHTGGSSLPERMRIDSAGDVLPGANGTQNLGSASKQWNIMYGTATSAQYADLAEKYHTDHEYEPGTVLVFGGAYEATQSTSQNDHSVMGVISTDPAYMMNSGAPGQYVALTGRVPCKVTGIVMKGDLMVTSDVPGHAMVNNNAQPGRIIGKAMENHPGGSGMIEVLINLM